MRSNEKTKIIVSFNNFFIFILKLLKIMTWINELIEW